MNDAPRFKKVVIAGITFQAELTAIDSATIMSALAFQLTGSPLGRWCQKPAVGLAGGIASFAGLPVVFAISMLAAVGQFILLLMIYRRQPRE